MISFIHLLSLVFLPSTSSFLIDSIQGPRFLQQDYVFNIYEMSAVATYIGAVSAVTKDTGTISYSLSDSSGAFTIDRHTGLLSTRQVLDREMRDVYHLTVSATLGDGESSSVNVTIHVFDVNDNAPMFERYGYMFFIKSNATISSLVGTVRATDVDMGLNGMITYSLQFTENSPFTIGPSNGAIRLTNHPGRQKYIGKVIASDTGLPSRSATASLEIDVEGITSSPTLAFSSNNFTFSVVENDMIGTRIGTISATTKSTGSISYSLSDSSGAFTIDRNTGLLSTRQVLDREMRDVYHLTVSATLGDGESSSVNVTIHVFDVNDNVPMFERNGYMFFIKSNATISSLVGTVRATDADMGLNGMITYSLQFTENSPFTIGPSNGAIRLTNHPGRQKYIGKVIASDTGLPSRSATASLEIDVEGITSSPTLAFSSNNFTFSVVENNMIGTRIGMISATTKSTGSILYSLSDSSGAFTIDRNTGLLSTRQVLDREMRDVYHLTVSATLGDGESSSVNVTIHVFDVNDNVPIFERNGYMFFIKSNATISSLVGTVRATDADMGLNGMITYSLQFTENSPFTIGPFNGAIRLTNHPGRQKYIGKVIASDTGLPSRSATASLEIDVEGITSSPTLAFSSNNFTFSVVENDMIGTRIGTISATTKSTGSILYSLTDSSGAFTIDRNTGLLSTRQVLDREMRDVYHLTVSATLGDGESSSVNVTIHVSDVNDNAPMFERYGYMFFIKSNATLGSLVGTVRATDADVGLNGMITYSLRLIEDSPFSIDASNGAIRLTKFPVLQKYLGHIIASDSGTPYLISAARLEIDIQMPMFSSSSYYFVVKENQIMGTQVGKVKATTNSTLPIIYTLLDGTDTFTINRYSGIIITRRSLDREDIGLYYLTVSASVGHWNQNNSVIIGVIDVNDNAPVFQTNNYTFTIPSNTSIGYIFGEARAFDPDSGVNSQLRYSLQFSGANPFSINLNDGSISLREKPLLKHYVGKITATDLGTPNLTGTATIEVDIITIPL